MNSSSKLFKAAGIIAIVFVSIILIVSIAIVGAVWFWKDGFYLFPEYDNMHLGRFNSIFKIVFSTVFLLMILGIVIVGLIGGIKMLTYSSMTDEQLRHRSVLAWSIVLLFFGTTLAGILAIVGYAGLNKGNYSYSDHSNSRPY